MIKEKDEIFKNIPGYEGRYQISNYGRIWNINRQIIQAVMLKKDGYLGLSLTNQIGKLKNERVHRLVALTFIPNPNNYPIVNHLDENKLNNKLENLEWTTNKENIIYSMGKSVTKIDPITKEKIATFRTVTEAAKSVDRHKASISSSIKHNHKCAGFYWIYE